MPSRFGSPRGSIPRILREAGEVADARMRAVQRYLDDFTAIDDASKHQVGGGGRLTRTQFQALLQGNPDFQQQIANRWLFSNQAEKDALLKQLREVFPEEMSKATGGVPGPVIPPEQQGTGLGGAPQGAAPVGPQPQPGAAPLPQLSTPGALEALPPVPPGPPGPSAAMAGPPLNATPVLPVPGIPGMPPTPAPPGAPGAAIPPPGVGGAPLPAPGVPPFPPPPLPGQLPPAPRPGPPGAPGPIAAAARMV